jgi:hybrid cluster-associated redox disulfide protein
VSDAEEAGPMPQYTRTMLIRDVLTSHGGAAAVFERHGLACSQCLGAEMETLDSVASMHDISVEVLLQDLNHLEPAEGKA